MKHYAKIQRRLSLYDRQLFRGDSLLAANYYKIKYDTTYISRPHARWTIKLRGNLFRSRFGNYGEDGWNGNPYQGDGRLPWNPLHGCGLSWFGAWFGCKPSQAGWQESGL